MLPVSNLRQLFRVRLSLWRFCSANNRASQQSKQQPSRLRQDFCAFGVILLGSDLVSLISAQ